MGDLTVTERLEALLAEPSLTTREAVRLANVTGELVAVVKALEAQPCRREVHSMPRCGEDEQLDAQIGCCSRCVALAALAVRLDGGNSQ